MSSRIMPIAATRRRQSRRCPWSLLLPVVGVVAACCPLPIADTAWCPLPVAAVVCVVAVVADPTTHGE